MAYLGASGAPVERSTNKGFSLTAKIHQERGKTCHAKYNKGLLDLFPSITICYCFIQSLQRELQMLALLLSLTCSLSVVSGQSAFEIVTQV